MANEINPQLTITAETNADGKWILTDNGGNTLQEGFAYETREDAMEAATQLWPANSVWHGRKDGDGWSIEI